MAKYIYPAVFVQEEAGYSIHFPDLESCYTSGETLEEGMEMAEDVLCLTLYELEEDGEPIPPASDMRKVSEDTKGGGFATLISCDTMEYRRHFDSRSVKKTLTIPAWLNDMAVKKNVNFSQLLQNALKENLNV